MIELFQDLPFYRSRFQIYSNSEVLGVRTSHTCELPTGPKGFSKPVCWAAPSTVPPDTWVSIWAVPSNKLGAFFFFKAKLRNPNKTPIPRPRPQILIQLTEAHPGAVIFKLSR